MRTRSLAAAAALALAGVGLVAVPAQAAPITCTYMVGSVYYQTGPNKPHEVVLVKASHLGASLVTDRANGVTYKKRLQIGIDGQAGSWNDLAKQGAPAFTAVDITATVKGSVCTYLPGDPSNPMQ